MKCGLSRFTRLVSNLVTHPTHTLLHGMLLIKHCDKFTFTLLCVQRCDEVQSFLDLRDLRLGLSNNMPHFCIYVFEDHTCN
jgi:hypothetical protein